MPEATANNSNSTPDAKLQIRLTTQNLKYLLPSTPIYVPEKLSPKGLTELLHHLFNISDKSTVFNFSINSLMLNGSLALFVAEQKLSREQVLDIDFNEAVDGPELVESISVSDWIACVDVSEEGVIVLGLYDKTTRVYNEAGLLLDTLQHDHVVKAVCWISETQCVSGLSNGELIVWEFVNDKIGVKYECIGHEGAINCIALGKSTFASASLDKCVCVWDLMPAFMDDDGSKKRAGQVKRAAPLMVLEGHTASVNACCYNGDALYSGGYDYSVRRWDLGTQEAAVLSGDKPILAMDVNDKGNVVTGHTDRTVRVWDFESKKIKKHNGSNGWTCGVAWIDHIRFASCCYDGSVRTWDARHTEALNAVEGSKKLLSLCFKNGKIYSGGEDKELRIFKLD